MLAHLVRRQAFRNDGVDAVIGWTTRAYRGAWATYAVATLLALLVPIASFAAYLAIVCYFLIPRGIDADL
jgi:hypothetical protein